MQSIKRFEENLRIRGFSPNTRSSYLSFATRFEQFRRRRDKAPYAEQVRDFLLYLRDERTVSSSTICVAYSSLKRYTFRR